MDDAKGCPYIIRDKHTGLYIRIVDCDDMPAEYEIQLTDHRERATTISGWGYALSAAMQMEFPFILERL